MSTLLLPQRGNVTSLRRIAARRAICALAGFAVGCGTTSPPAPSGQPPRPAPLVSVLPPTIQARVGSSDDVPIAYRVRGAGEPTLVLVHGWAGSSAQWEAVEEALATRHRVVVLDLAGHGRSGADRYDWSIERLADDVEAVVRAVGATSVVLIGHGMGGEVAARAALDLAGQVRAVIGVESFHDLAHPPDPAFVGTLLASLGTDFAGTVGQLVREVWFAPTADLTTVARVGDELATTRPEVAKELLRSSLDFDTAGILARLPVPVLALNSATLPSDPEGNRRLAPNLRVVSLPGDNTFPQLTDPAGLTTALESVVAELTTNPR